MSQLQVKVVRVQCTSSLNIYTRRVYRYLTKGQTYEALDEGGVYVIRTPRGKTHYPKRNFRVVNNIFEYSPTQEGDRDDDI